jgi:hypothetical protein
MGLEMTGRVRFASTGAVVQTGTARILLETDNIILRGGVRGRVPRSAVRGAEVRGGNVTVRYEGGVLTLSLGDGASRFAAKVLEAPKSRVEKMGISSDTVVVLCNIKDSAFRAELQARKVTALTRRARSNQMIILSVEAPGDLPRIEVVARSLAPSGVLWVIHPKGRAGVKDTDIFAVAKCAGLTYTKVVRFSETHTAEKLVIPVAARSSANSAG